MSFDRVGNTLARLEGIVKNSIEKCKTIPRKILAMQPLPTEHTSDPLDAVQRRLDSGEAVLWDVREQHEWAEGHLQCARLMPLSVLQHEFQEGRLAARLGRQLPADKIVYCHCAHGVRVLQAASMLQALGCDVRPLRAGYDELRAAGFADSRS
jgi:rhodanese-related sulfurtransferase